MPTAAGGLAKFPSSGKRVVSFELIRKEEEEEEEEQEENDEDAQILYSLEAQIDFDERPLVRAVAVLPIAIGSIYNIPFDSIEL